VLTRITWGRDLQKQALIVVPESANGGLEMKPNRDSVTDFRRYRQIPGYVIIRITYKIRINY
jgi:hypothetical protein